MNLTNIKKLDKHTEMTAQKNRERTTIKVTEALKRLKKAKKPINIQMVAREAGISRKTLYNREDLKVLIEETKSLMNDVSKSEIKKSSSGKLNEQRIKGLREKNKELQSEKQELLEQNAGLTELVWKLQEKIADLEERLYKDTSVTLLKKKK
jgi:Family of unknown function (DUF6262)